MSILRENMIRDMQLKGYSPNTQSAYVNHIKKYVEYFNKSPDRLGIEEIKQYLHYLIIIKKVSKSYVNSAYSALRFLYETTLKREWNIKEIPRVKKSKKLPVILSVSEVEQIFTETNNLKHKAILMTIYAAGLRVSEVANLRISDIDSKNMQIRIRQGKGEKDRYTILSYENLKILRDYWKYYQTKEWLFPGNPPDRPISTRSIQKIFKNAKDKAGIKKDATVHTLRHCFATHLLESGVDIYHIQHLLGHTNPKTTSIYIHLTRKDVLNIKSPLDLMVGANND